MKDLIIRFVEKRDLKALVELCRLHAEYEKADYTSEGKAQQLKEHLFSANPSLHCLVAEMNNEIIGYVSYMKQFSTWDAHFYIYMDCLFLTEKTRSLGIGELLINQLKEESRKLGCELIQWQTPDFNVRAQKFYKRIGASAKSKERYFLPTI